MPAGVLLDVLSVTFLVPVLHVQVDILKGYLPLSLKSFHQLTSLSQNHSGIIHQILYGNLNKGLTAHGSRICCVAVCFE